MDNDRNKTKDVSMK